MKACLFLILIITLSISCSRLDNINPIFESEAYQAYQENNFDKAVNLFENFKDVNPNNKVIQLYSNFYLGKIYTQKGKVNKAINHLEKVVKFRDNSIKKVVRRIVEDETFPTRHKASLILSGLYHDKGNYQKSIKYVEKAKWQFTYFSCGFEAVDRYEQMDSLLLLNYLALRNWEKSFDVLGNDLWGLNEDSDSIILEKLQILISKKYSKIEITEALEYSVSNITKSKNTIKTEENWWFYDYKTELFGIEFKIQGETGYNPIFHKKLENFVLENERIPIPDEVLTICKEIITGSDFYKKLNE